MTQETTAVRGVRKTVYLSDSDIDKIMDALAEDGRDETQGIYDKMAREQSRRKNGATVGQ